MTAAYVFTMPLVLVNFYSCFYIEQSISIISEDFATQECQLQGLFFFICFLSQVDTSGFTTSFPLQEPS